MKLKKPILLDKLVHQSKNSPDRCGIDGKWYLSKPVPFYSWETIVKNFYHAWLVVRGKASAYQYAQDRHT